MSNKPYVFKCSPEQRDTLLLVMDYACDNLRERALMNDKATPTDKLAYKITRQKVEELRATLFPAIRSAS